MPHRSPRPRAIALRIDSSTLIEIGTAGLLAMFVSWMIAAI